MATKEGSLVHPWYGGNHEWQVQAIAKLPEPIAYADPVQGKVDYDPRILWLKCPERAKALWFAYWISTDKTQGRVKWGQGPPMMEESTLLSLLKDAIRQGFFAADFLKELAQEIDGALRR